MSTGTVTPPSMVAPTPPAAGGLTHEQLAALAEGRLRCKKVRRAAFVAAFSGWSMAIFASITILFGLFSLRGFLLGLALAVVARVELRGAQRLKLFDLKTPMILAINQAGLAIAITVYSVWGLAETLFGPGRYDQYLEAGGEMAEMLQPIDDLSRGIAVVVYVGMIAASFVAQGSAAVYYATRRRHIEAYLGETPPWVVKTLQAASL